jgi:hypothetical protein
MRRIFHFLAISAITLSASVAEADAAVSTFDGLLLAPNSFYFPAASTNFVSGPATYNHHFEPPVPPFPGCCWNGWTYSNMTDTTTPGFENQYSAYPGSGVNGSTNYGVAFLGGGVGDPSPAVVTTAPVMFATPSLVSGAYFTNTTYAALAMRDGYFNAKKFGGISGNDPDFLELIITGWDTNGNITGTKDFFLADYRFADNSLDYVVTSWTPVDLSSLGAVKQLTFGLVSSDNDPMLGMNTPAYFAMDSLDVSAVPEPSSIVLLLSGLAVMIGIVRRRTAS